MWFLFPQRRDRKNGELELKAIPHFIWDHTCWNLLACSVHAIDGLAECRSRAKFVVNNKRETSQTANTNKPKQKRNEMGSKWGESRQWVEEWTKLWMQPVKVSTTCIRHNHLVCVYVCVSVSATIYLSINLKTSFWTRCVHHQIPHNNNNSSSSSSCSHAKLF